MARFSRWWSVVVTRSCEVPTLRYSLHSLKELGHPLCSGKEDPSSAHSAKDRAPTAPGAPSAQCLSSGHSEAPRAQERRRLADNYP